MRKKQTAGPVSPIRPPKAISLKLILPASALPSGRGWEWNKRGGYADATLKAVFRKATAAGFVRADTRRGDSPDGNVVGSGTYYRDPFGNTLYVSTSYGVTSRENRFTVRMTLAPAPAPAPVEVPPLEGPRPCGGTKRAEYYGGN